jgi:hypothetical protein
MGVAGVRPASSVSARPKNRKLVAGERYILIWMFVVGYPNGVSVASAGAGGCSLG